MSKTLMCLIAAILFIPTILLGVVLVCINVKVLGWSMIIIGSLFLLIILPIIINYFDSHNIE